MRRFFSGLVIMALAAPLAHANDDQIAQQIVKSLKANQAQGNLKNFNLGLQVRDGDVYLSGHVANARQEQLAIRSARAVDGVGKVFSEITVQQSKAAVATAETTESHSSPEKVHLANAQENTGRAANVRLALLEDDSQRGRASSRTRAQAKAIATEIIRRLREEKSSGNLRGFGIDVEVDRGVVWLKGKVSSEDQELLALETARRVPGVKQVINDLSVSSSKPETSVVVATSDHSQALQPVAANSDEIAQSIVKRLQAQKRNGNLQNFGIDVHVDEGVVWLSGYVPSRRQERLALDMARYVPGVKRVVNDLTISTRSSATGTAPAVLNTAGNRSSAANSLMPAQYLSGQGTQAPLAFSPARAASHDGQVIEHGAATPTQMRAPGVGITPARFDHPQMPGYAWPSYAPHPNYGAVTYPKQYSASAWPYIGPFYPYPQVPLGWRKVTLEWDDGWWHLDFKNRR